VQAQARFRERKRTLAQQQEESYITLMEKLEPAFLDNEQLWLRHRSLQAVCAVNKTFLAVLGVSLFSKRKGDQGNIEAQNPLASRKAGTVEVVAGATGSEKNKDGMGKFGNGDLDQDQGTRTTAVELEGEETNLLENVKNSSPLLKLPKYPKALRHAVILNTPEAFVEYWHRWRVELCFGVKTAQMPDAGLKETKKVEAIFNFMEHVWWYNARLYPMNFKLAMQALLPLYPADGEPLWRRAAEAVIDRVTPKSLATLRSHFLAYKKCVQDQRKRQFRVTESRTNPSFLEAQEAGAEASNIENEVWGSMLELFIAWCRVRNFTYVINCTKMHASTVSL